MVEQTIQGDLWKSSYVHSVEDGYLRRAGEQPVGGSEDAEQRVSSLLLLCVCVYACVRACVRECACVRARVCVQ